MKNKNAPLYLQVFNFGGKSLDDMCMYVYACACMCICVRVLGERPFYAV